MTAMETQTPVRWAIISAKDELLDAALAAGLDANALDDQLPGAGEGEAGLAWPSFFCPEPRRWLAALALLVDREAPLRLYVLQDGPEPGSCFTARLYPPLDGETRDLLQDFSPDSMAAVAHASQQVNLAIGALRRAAGLEPG